MEHQREHERRGELAHLALLTSLPFPLQVVSLGPEAVRRAQGPERSRR